VGDPVGNELNSDSGGQKSGSIPENKLGFTVSASPLNPVKLELGLILVIGFFAFFIITYSIDSVASQFIFLGAYGLFGMMWIIHRARKLMAQMNSQAESET